MKKQITIYIAEFVLSSSIKDLIPKKYREQIWDEVCDSAPFSWGDNNRSMVTAECFADHCDEVLDGSTVPKNTAKNWINKIRELGQMYIDLEN